MAVYKIFPSKDSTLYSYYPVMNTGLDAICEVSNTLDPIMRGEVPMVARYLMQFKTEDIKDVIDNKIGTHSYDVNVRILEQMFVYESTDAAQICFGPEGGG